MMNTNRNWEPVALHDEHVPAEWHFSYFHVQDTENSTSKGGFGWPQAKICAECFVYFAGRPAKKCCICQLVWLFGGFVGFVVAKYVFRSREWGRWLEKGCATRYVLMFEMAGMQLEGRWGLVFRFFIIQELKDGSCFSFLWITSQTYYGADVLFRAAK